MSVGILAVVDASVVFKWQVTEDKVQAEDELNRQIERNRARLEQELHGEFTIRVWSHEPKEVEVQEWDNERWIWTPVLFILKANSR